MSGTGPGARSASRPAVDACRRTIGGDQGATEKSVGGDGWTPIVVGGSPSPQVRKKERQHAKAIQCTHGKSSFWRPSTNSSVMRLEGRPRNKGRGHTVNCSWRRTQVQREWARSVRERWRVVSGGSGPGGGEQLELAQQVWMAPQEQQLREE